MSSLASNPARACAITVLLSLPAPVSSQVRVVNVIPRRLSAETFQNSEPTLAVNPVDPAVMAAASFTPAVDICRRRTSDPIFVSLDSGQHWRLLCKFRVDSSSANLSPGDVSLRWSLDGRTLYAALLWPTLPPLTMRVLGLDRSNFGAPARPSGAGPLHEPPVLRGPVGRLLGAGLMPVTASFSNVDQPNLEIGMTSKGQRLLVGANFKGGVDGPGTAGIIVSRGLVLGGGRLKPIPVEYREIVGQNFSIRLATHRDNTAYAVFYSPLDGNDSPLVNVTVVRDDDPADGKATFRALVDTPYVAGDDCSGRDTMVGVRVVRCRPLAMNFEEDKQFGLQRRVGANLSIAIDPRDSRRVWVAWADSSDTSHYTLHVRGSRNGGQTWSDDAVAVPNATNPALALSENGTVGFLFQQLTDTGSAQRWTTRLLLSSDEFATSRSFVLASVPIKGLPAAFQPYIGDYIELRTVGATFYGIFSANNTPDTANFPNGVSYQRHVDFERKRLLVIRGTAEIAPSIDPFFFSVGPDEYPECTTLARNGPALRRRAEIGCRPTP